MREALCFLLLFFVILFGWKQPYRHHYHQLAGIEDEPPPSMNLPIPPAPGAPAPAPRASATPPRPPQPPADRNWIFDKTRMDEPTGGKGARGGK